MKKIIVIPFLLIAFACELIVDIDVPAADPKLTLNSFFMADTVWKAKLSTDRYILDKEPFNPVEDALLVVYHNNNPIDTLSSMGNGIYRAASGTPTNGETYEIRATSQKFGTVFARSHIPLPTPIGSVEITFPEPATIEMENLQVSIKLKFTDTPGRSDFYRIVMISETEYINSTTGKTSVYRGPVYLTSNNPALDNEDHSTFEDIYFKDVLFEGKEVTMHFNANYWEAIHAERLTLYLETLSEDFFKYKTTASLQERTSGDPFAQPVNVFNNVVNGFGIFAGYSSSSYTYENLLAQIKPIITGVTPSKGKPGDTVTVTGKNFSKDIHSNVVRFNGSWGQVIQASDTALVVIVPQWATTGKISVTTYPNSKTAMSDTIFEVIK